MARPDVPPVNENPTLQAKLDGSAPAPAVAPVPAPAAVPPVVPPVVPPAVPPVASAPAVAPVVPAVAAPVVPAVAPAELQLPAGDLLPAPKWEATGNENLDAIGTLFDERGFDGTEALAEFNAHGEISQETYDGMVAALGEPTARLAHQQFDTAVSALKQDAQASADKVYEAVGGKATWDQVATWSKQLPETERGEYNKLLKAGGVAAALAAKALQEKMMADPNFKSRAVLVGSGAAPVAAGQPVAAVMLDRVSYGKAMRVAEGRGDQQAIVALRASAKHSMKNNPNWRIGNPA